MTTGAAPAFAALFTVIVHREEEGGLIGFGIFSCVQRKTRTGRNPETGSAIRIPTRKIVLFRAGKGLGDAVNIMTTGNHPSFEDLCCRGAGLYES